MDDPCVLSTMAARSPVPLFAERRTVWGPCPACGNWCLDAPYDERPAVIEAIISEHDAEDHPGVLAEMARRAALRCTGPVAARDRSRRTVQYAVQFYVNHDGEESLHSIAVSDLDEARSEVVRLTDCTDRIERRDFRILQREVGDWVAVDG